MAEYIEREAVLALLKDDREVCTYSKVELKYIRADIHYLPAADVQPVVRGEWRKIGKIGCIFVCSACDKTFPCKTDFCPNCGADMREVDDAL